MRFLVRLIVLGFAGFGMYKTWELIAPKVSDVRQRAEGARGKIEPAIRDAADTLQTATKDAAETITEASREATSDARVGDTPAPPKMATRLP